MKMYTSKIVNNFYYFNIYYFYIGSEILTINGFQSQYYFYFGAKIVNIKIVKIIDYFNGRILIVNILTNSKYFV